MGIVTVTDTATAITDGTETSDTMVRIGVGTRVIIGSPSGRTFADATPMNWGQLILVPAGVEMYGICAEGETAPTNKEVGFSA